MAIPRKIREEILKQATYSCEYCKSAEEYTASKLELDHIVPESKGGTDDSHNLCACCRNCNSSKLTAQTAIDPETSEQVILFNPREQKWHEHFAWSDNYTQIRGLTACGRATIERLKMNRSITVKARLRWRQAGWLPPQD